MRVFISSTFRDMFEEREELIKKVFPQIRKICAERFVTFTEVDLRWGITNEQTAEGKVLPLCLEEIRLSRPYFIGLLGERYGWVQGTIDEELEIKEPWLKENRDSSVTELEILHGVLNDPHMNANAFFYFRDPSYCDTIDKAKQPDYFSKGPGEKEKLERLKCRIRNAYKEGKLRYEPRENYANPKSLGTIVLKDLKELIDKLFPVFDIQDADTLESEAQEIYASVKRMCYVEFLGTMETFDNLVNEGGRLLVVTGESGSGKTAFLSHCAKRQQNKYPEEFFFQHYFGATTESEVLSAVRRLLSELKKRFNIEDEIPSIPSKLRNALTVWLARVKDKGRIVIILDALNQIEGEEWLPYQVPENVCVICSAQPGPILEELKKRNCSTFKLPEPSVNDRKEIIKVFLIFTERPLQKTLRRSLRHLYKLQIRFFFARFLKS